jgi:hypothetical protein
MSDFHRLKPFKPLPACGILGRYLRIGRHAQSDFQRISDCGGIRGELVCGKRRPAVWRCANGRSANSCGCYRGGTGILARTVESHFEPHS